MQLQCAHSKTWIDCLIYLFNIPKVYHFLFAICSPRAYTPGRVSAFVRSAGRWTLCGARWERNATQPQANKIGQPRPLLVCNQHTRQEDAFVGESEKAVRCVALLSRINLHTITVQFIHIFMWKSFIGDGALQKHCAHYTHWFFSYVCIYLVLVYI